MANKVLDKKIGQQKFLKGVRGACGLVGDTMGPGGGAVRVASHSGDYDYLRDGLKAASKFVPRGLTERLGADNVVAMAMATVREAGDGSSHTCVMALDMYESALECLEKTPRWKLIEELKGSIVHVHRLIDEVSVPVVKKGTVDKKLVRSVVGTAVNGDPVIAKVISDMVVGMGVEGNISMSHSANGKWEAESYKGVLVPGGVGHNSFLNGGRSVAFSDAKVVVCVDVIDGAEQVKELLTVWDKRIPLVIVCPAVIGNAHSLLVDRRLPDGSRAPLAWVKCEKDIVKMTDLANVLGATLFDKFSGTGLKDFEARDFGSVSHFSADVARASFVPSDGASLSRLTEALGDQKEVATEKAVSDGLKGRLELLNGAFGIIRIPAATEPDFAYLREIVEDGYRAGFSSLKEGAIVGGGVALLRIAYENGHLPDAVLSGLKSVSRRVYGNVSLDFLENAGLEPAEIINARDGRIVDAMKEGIVDCAFVAKSAYKNACEAVCGWLNTTNWIEDED